jgi:molybdopterin/thiamine biosynthesis adenylyltransferase
MINTLVLPHALAEQLHEALRLPVETGGVLLASIAAAANGDLRLLGQKIIWTPEHAYLKRERDELLITSDGYIPALAEAEQRRCMAFWLHTHPGENGIPLPSVYDKKVDRDLADVFRLRTDAPYYGALIVSPRKGGLGFSGGLHGEQGVTMRIDRLWSVGDDYRLSTAYDAPTAAVPDIFDRNVRAFGPAIQAALGQMRIGVVGAGGTGSSVCEQLVRLGVRNLVLIDPDKLTASNVTRVYGSTPADIGNPKVEILRNYLQRIAPDLSCETVDAMLTLETTARRLIGCDVVFGCTDDNAGRLVLSRYSTYILTPVIDVGVLLSSGPSGELLGIDGRITILSPGSPCLICRNRIDLARAAAELHTPEERKRLIDEGYAPALERVEPAVVAFTTSVAAAAVAELLERLIGYGPQPRPNEILLRLHEREISTNAASSREGHYCHHDAGKWGYGPGEPFLEMTWPCP